MWTIRVNLTAVCLALAISPAIYAQVDVINARIQRGPEAAAKVNAAIAKNPHLKEAIARMESRGTHSHIEAATIISGIAVPANRSTNASSPRVGATSETISGDDVEITFIPNTYYYGYWDGTVDAQLYDANGTLLDEYIGNVTGQAADPSSGLDCTYEDVTYAYDIGGDYGDGGGGGGGPYTYSLPEKGQRQRTLPPGEHHDVRAFRKVSAQGWLGHWGDWGKCSGAWCVGAAAGCGAANLVDAEIGWLPCTGAGCIAGAIGCTHGTLWK
jgi:hypothetical protein